jgi:hypothetical protein
MDYPGLRGTLAGLQASTTAESPDHQRALK